MGFSWQEIVARILAVFALIVINGFFVAAEFSMVAVRRSRINQLVDAGDVQAKTVQDLQRSIDRLLSTTQIGITLSSLALGWIGESAVVDVVQYGLESLRFPVANPLVLAHSIAIPTTFFLLAYLQIVIGELFPKAVALIYAEGLARFLGAPSLAIARLFSPFICILNQSTRSLLRLFGIRYSPEGWYDQLTPEELQRIITAATESTGLEAEEREILRNVFEFGEVTAGEVMIPRTNIVAIASDATFHDFLAEVARSKHSRYPVIGESLDDVRGILYFKELAEPLATGALTLDSPIEAWVRPVRFVLENTVLGELLPQMQRSRQPMTMVVDEYGGTAGLVTLEDLIAEILGDAAEPVSTEELNVQILDDQTFVVQAQMYLEEVNELLNLELPMADDYLTLAGFIIYQLQKIPQPGEQFEYDGYEFTIISTEGPRLHQVQIRRLEMLNQDDELIKQELEEITETTTRDRSEDYPVDTDDFLE